MTKMRSIIVLHGRDLRIHNLPSLIYAEKTKLHVIPLYIHDPKIEDPWALGGASKWWLHHSLCSLQKDYQSIGSNLGILQGNTVDVLEKVCAEYAVEEICLSKRFCAQSLAIEKKLTQYFEKKGIKVSFHCGSYLTHPEKILNGSGHPYSVFTPFYKTALKELHIKTPQKAPSLEKFPKGVSTSVENLGLLPTISWDKEIKKTWVPGSAEARKKLLHLKNTVLANYSITRDFFFEEASSRLSPYLAFGEISPAEIWFSLEGKDGADPFLRQLIWREFGNYFIYHYPKSPSISFRPAFEEFEWENGKRELSAWTKGLTGYPIVDAAMRDLRKTGWMPNRARMIVGSFLTKDLLIHWKKGALWFWDNLVDADLANNTLGWQWISGSGPDAAPYFRIFNPITQSKKFDPDGNYIRSHIPELALLPNKWIHTPFLAPAEVLEQAGVVLGKTYPNPIVDHDTQRKIALKRFTKINNSSK